MSKEIPKSPKQCRSVAYRYLEGRFEKGRCKLDSGHTGDHDYEPIPPKARESK